MGLHRLGGRDAPLGVPRRFSRVCRQERIPGSNEIEPNDDDPGAIKPIVLPAVLLGAIERPGDVDHFRFQARAGQQFVFSARAARGSWVSNLRGLLCAARRSRTGDCRGRQPSRAVGRSAADGDDSTSMASIRCGSPTWITVGRGTISTGSRPVRRPYLSACISAGRRARGQASTVCGSRG